MPDVYRSSKAREGGSASTSGKDASHQTVDGIRPTGNPDGFTDQTSTVHHRCKPNHCYISGFWYGLACAPPEVVRD
ncbi:hypothetical protein PISMIDRAFT_509671 [Pisolithus microcarpus 441]|uniref:Unplaced genomic scaffold scaffold_58, whole genome shotgun sequence n=1 Tax=Pisolithus microcarpus 441 TaxID=765257 RepID=A0A0C9YBQ3_9AGAM|nr:hypothetical protein PISMIDRAFT_509671 [Pisolithus microcarpus 441]